MKYFYYIVLIVISIFTTTTHAQESCCDKLRQAGIEAYNKGDYADAIKKWEAAKTCATKCKTDDLDVKIKEANRKLNPPKSNFNRVTPSTKSQRLPYEPEMVFVKSSTFIMGCKEERDKDCYDGEKPAHSVTVKDFYIGKYEVTVAQFKAFVDASRYQTDADKEGGSRVLINGEWKMTVGINWMYDAKGKKRPVNEYNHPVLHINLRDAVAYTQWLSKKTGKKYRLPTESEWEYAARGGNKSKNYLFAGSDNISEVAWYADNADGKTHPVGKKMPNELGLFDMSGNVWEWVQDCWNASYKEAPTNGSAWINCGEIGTRILRGGSWWRIDGLCRISMRGSDVSTNRAGDMGFRIVQEK